MEDNRQEDGDSRGLRTLYCAHCGVLNMILGSTRSVEEDVQIELGRCPARKTDGAFVLIQDIHVRRNKMIQDKRPTRLRRKTDSTIEVQCRLRCPSCRLFVAYRSGSGGKREKFLYVLPDALTADPSDVMLRADAARKEIAAEKSSSSLKASTPRSDRPQCIRDNNMLGGVEITVRPVAGSDKATEITSVANEYVTVSVLSPVGDEWKTNTEIKRFFAAVFHKASSDSIRLDFGDTDDTIHVGVKRVRAVDAHRILKERLLSLQ